MTEVAVIVAHPDDEVLACGGAIARHAAAGDLVRILILATGAAARNIAQADGPIARLRAQACKASEILGCPSPTFMDFPDNQMDTVPLLDIVQAVEGFIAAGRPDIVFTHHAGDINIDHAVTARAVLTACRPLPGQPSRILYGCEVLSSTEYGAPEARFQPNSYLGIKGYVDAKCAALEAYVDEIRPWPHPRSADAVRHLAGLRGAESGLAAAEAFTVVRQVTA